MSKKITFWPSESCTQENSEAVMASVRALPQVEAVTCVKWPTNPASVMGVYVVFLRDDADELTMQQVIGDMPGVGCRLNAEDAPE